MDSACTSHLFKSQEGFISLDSTPVAIHIAGGKTLMAKGRGTCRRKVVLPNGKEEMFTFHDALWVPELVYDLISTRRLDDLGYTITFSRGMGNVVDKAGKMVMFSELSKGLYCLAVPTEKCNACLSGVDLLHRRFGHVSTQYLQQWLSSKDKKTLSFCDACATMKSTRRPFKHSNNLKHNVKKPLDLVVSDLCGPFRVASLAGSRYFGTIIDIYSRFIFVFFVRNKDDVSSRLEDWYKYVRTQTGKVPKIFQSDGGGEYISGETRAVFIKAGSRYVTTAADSSNQNAVAERANRTLMESARAMMAQAGAYKSLWEEAVRYAAFLRNLTPHHSNDMSSPADIFPLLWMKSKSLAASVRV